MIPHKKLTEYLLNSNHPDGWSKALFFKSMGVTKPELLQKILENIASHNPVGTTTDSPFGKKLSVMGNIAACKANPSD